MFQYNDIYLNSVPMGHYFLFLDIIKYHYVLYFQYVITSYNYGIYFAYIKIMNKINYKFNIQKE